MIKRIVMPALMLAMFAFGSLEAQETKSECCKKEQTECTKTECAKTECAKTECTKTECTKQEGTCAKQAEGSCCKKAQGTCAKLEGKACKKTEGTCAKEAKVCKKAESKKVVKESNDTTVVFAVEPKLVCNNCENRVKNELRFEKGVKKIDASAAEQRVTVTYDRRKSDVAKLQEAFAKIGYTAETKN